MNSEYLYLDLMKKTLAFTFWPEPPIPLDAFSYRKSLIKRQIISAITRVFKNRNYEVVRYGNVTTNDREEGRIWPGNAFTMIGLKRLDNLQNCIEAIIQDRVEGDLIETGVWRGGACILMRAVLAAYSITDRRVFVADSFEGLPPPDPNEFPADKGDTHYLEKFLRVSQEEVKSNFQKFGLLDSQVVFLKGWFKDTLPNAPMEKLAILRLDGDMYSSTMESLKNLYPKLSCGGFCIIDDYGLDGCKKAVDEFRAQNNIQADMKAVDWTGRYWRKT
jgi:O-methyltransferase